MVFAPSRDPTVKDIFSYLTFAQPSYLWLLLLVPVLWLRLSGRVLALLLWRTLVLLLLVLAAADLQWSRPASLAGERIFAFDLSRSIPGEMRRWMAEQEMTPRGGERVFVFAGDTKEVTDWKRWLSGEISTAPIEPAQTNLEGLFSTLLSMPPAPRSLFLFTDGWETRGEVDRLLPSLGSSAIRVLPVLPAERPVAANVALRRIIAPHQGTSGEGISLKVMVENQGGKAVDGTLTLKRGGRSFKSEEVKIQPGAHVFSYQGILPEEPMVLFEAIFQPRDPESDRFSQDNQAAAWLAVRAKGKVLLLNGRPGEGRYLEEILKRRGYEVTSVVAGAEPPALSGFQTVVFNNVERARFSPAYLAAVERHAAEGNSFLMLGAEASFAPGGYRQTPIERLLPVELKEPKREEKNRAVILVIDKSGSMREENRLLYAKEAAKAVARQLNDNDLLGVVGFDVEPFVVVPLSPLQKLRATVAGEIDRLKAQGQTYLLPALEEAMRQLQKESAGRKHVIVLSDGISRGAHGEYTDLVSFMRDKLRITTSSVAIGGEVDIPLLKRIAQYGGGFFHHTYDPTTLPQIVLQQMQDKPEAMQPAERHFTPLPVKGSELLAGFTERTYPAVQGYVETEVKPGARLDLALSGEVKAPLLASWSYGKGKALAFTTDLHGSWSREWIRWGALERFWAHLFEWLQPLRESLPPHEVRINQKNSRLVLELYLYADGHDHSLFRYSLSGKGRKDEGTLARLAPGHYQATLPHMSPGDYRIALVEERQTGRLTYPQLGYTLVFDPRAEIVRGEFNIALLEKLARATGGEINPKGEEGQKAPFVSHRLLQPLRVYIVSLAAVLFLAEIFFRRFYPPSRSRGGYPP